MRWIQAGSIVLRDISSTEAALKSMYGLQYLKSRVYVGSIVGDTDLLAPEMAGRWQEISTIIVLSSVAAFEVQHVQN